MQKLFLQMKVLDKQSQDTIFMNEYFGWKGNEVLQQHDIQEAAKIILDLIEKALFGTVYYDQFIQIIRGKFKLNIISRNTVFLYQMSQL
jgi:hypothetical protein